MLSTDMLSMQFGIISTVKNLGKNIADMFKNITSFFSMIIDFFSNIIDVIVNLISTMLSAITIPFKILGTLTGMTFLPPWILAFMVQGLGIGIVLFIINRK